LDAAAVVGDGGDCAHANSRIFPKMDIRSATPISVLLAVHWFWFLEFERLKKKAMGV
jgi:hypothetical protein